MIRKWTLDEIEIVSTYYPYVPATELVTLFPGRTAKGLRNLAHRMGIRQAPWLAELVGRETSKTRKGLGK